MCKFMKVSRSGYYNWLSRQNISNFVDIIDAETGEFIKLPYCKRKQEDIKLAKIIKSIFLESRCTYGTRRIKKLLARVDDCQINNNKPIIISRNRIGRLMKEAGLICKTKKKFRAVSYSANNNPAAPNLLNREFAVIKPDCCWVGDITYIPTQESWLYLAVVIDLYSRKVVGWSMDNNMQSKLVNDALLMAIVNRRPETKGLIWHTDQGSQYSSDSHRSLLRDFGIIQSMSRKGNCWDNAVSESFFHTLKTELIHHRKFKNIEEAKHEIFEYIEVFYNRTRVHSANDYLSPMEFEVMEGYV
jgi:putative transposase